MGIKRKLPRGQQSNSTYEEQKLDTHEDSLNTWVENLAQQVADPSLPSKAERVDKRKAKKRRREELKEAKSASSHVSCRPPNVPKSKLVMSADGSPSHKNTPQYSRSIQKSKLALIAKTFSKLVASTDQQKLIPYQQSILTRKNKKKNWDKETIQPRLRDYGGIGLARPSLFLSLSDPSFMPKLEEEFAEHIPGFYGKQRTKVMKKQLDRTMLWRQLAGNKGLGVNVNKKTLSKMTPDERVEAILQNNIPISSK